MVLLVSSRERSAYWSHGVLLLHWYAEECMQTKAIQKNQTNKVEKYRCGCYVETLQSGTN